jgi:hypothetical protein
MQDGWAATLWVNFLTLIKHKETKMKKFTKTLVAAAMLASAGGANAALTVDSLTQGNDMFLAVYNPNAVNADGTLGLTYNLDLNITYAQVKADAAAAFASINSLLSNLTVDSNWTAFTGLITTPGTVQYALAVGAFDPINGNTVPEGGIVSGSTPLLPNPLDHTVTPVPLGTQINQHASFINLSLGSGNSSLVKDIPATPFQGQFNNGTLTASQSWAGWPHDMTAVYGQSTNLYLAETVIRTFVDDFGDTVTQQTFEPGDTILLGSLRLAGNALTFGSGVPAVPLPAAVWMFGAGLMGMLRASRRKAA